MKEETKRHYRRDDKEFKQSAVKLVLEGTRPELSIAKDLGISRGVLNRWKQQYLKYKDNAFETEQMKAENIKMKQLNKKLKDVEEENKILKKPWPSFHNNPNEIYLH